MVLKSLHTLLAASRFRSHAEQICVGLLHAAEAIRTTCLLLDVLLVLSSFFEVQAV